MLTPGAQGEGWHASQSTLRSLFLEFDDGVVAFDPETGETRQYAPLAGWILMSAKVDGAAGLTLDVLAKALEATGDELQTVAGTLLALTNEGALERK